MDLNSKKFGSPQEEIAYWREAAQKFKHDLEETKEELEEFQISSRELESELEAQVEQLEKKNNNLEQQNSKYQHEVESLRAKLEELQGQTFSQISELENELCQVRAFKDELQKYIRELEQANDDLERAKRATVVSLEDFEQRLNQAIERNAFLESELDDKETLSETVQRLKDEARDLRSELSIKKKKDPMDSPLNSPGSTPTNSIPNPLTKKHILTNIKKEKEDSLNASTNASNHIQPQGGTVTPDKGIPAMNGGTPLTPSARISALNIVGDLLRKVGALENKLASCRNFVKDPPRGSNPRSGNSPVNSPSSALWTRIRQFTDWPNMKDVADDNEKTKRLTQRAVVYPQQNMKIPV